MILSRSLPPGGMTGGMTGAASPGRSGAGWWTVAQTATWQTLTGLALLRSPDRSGGSRSRTASRPRLGCGRGPSGAPCAVEVEPA